MIKWAKLSTKQMYFICQQLSFALESGMSLPQGLRLAAEELSHTASKTFLTELYQSMEQGRLISEALAYTSVNYAPVFLEFVLAGEQNGTMAEALHQAAAYFQQQHKTRQLLFSTLCYPAILLFLMLFAFGAMLMFVVPAVVSTYQNVQAALPPSTQFLLMVGAWLKQYWVRLFCGSVLLAVFLFWSGKRLLRHPRGRNLAKTLLLKVPIVGTLYQYYWFIQISQGLGLMLNSGMLLVNGLHAVGQIYQRSLFSDELIYLRDHIAAGSPWADCLVHCMFVPRLAKQMLIVSEQSGKLPKALQQMQQYYQQQFQQRVQVLMSILEPCVIIILGIGILAMASSLFLPLVQSYQYLL